MITGVNHITLAITDLPRSITFYTEVLSAQLEADWPAGAYLDLGGLWLCLALEDQVAPRQDDTHIAFSTDNFAGLQARIMANAPLWKDNQSEGASVYFLDPDGHKLEVHDGDMQSRLDSYRARGDTGVHIHETSNK